MPTYTRTCLHECIHTHLTYTATCMKSNVYRLTAFLHTLYLRAYIRAQSWEFRACKSTQVTALIAFCSSRTVCTSTSRLTGTPGSSTTPRPAEPDSRREAHNFEVQTPKTVGLEVLQTNGRLDAAHRMRSSVHRNWA